MAICITNPIEQDKFNKLVRGLTLVLGKEKAGKEAARDYKEQNDMVRPPSVVLKKIRERENKKEESVFFSPEDFISPETVEVPEEEDTSLVIEGIINERNSLVSEAAINDMSSRLGIPYSFITESESITKGAGTSKGFYRGAEVFFVLGKFTPETVFHEFMHPVIKSMAIDNPELFNQLYQDVLKHDWGKNIESIVKEDDYYKDQSESNIQQEVTVQALTYMNENAIDNRTLLDKFLYQIRQFMRKMLGKKINVAKLDLNTSLEDLIEMMNKSEEFELNKEFLKLDDVIMMEKDYNKKIAELNKQSAETAQKMINEFRSILKKQVGLMQEDRGIYKLISNDLINDKNTGMLQEMLKGMKEITTEIGSSKDVLTVPLSDFDFDDPQAMMDRVNHFIEVVSKTNVVFGTYQKIIDNIGEITDMNGIEMEQLHAISTIADKWSLYFFQQDNSMADEHYENIFPEGGVVQNTMSDLKKKAIKLRNSVNNKRYDIVAEVTYRLAKEESVEIEKFYTDKLKLLFDKGAVREYNRVYWQYHGVTVDEQNTIDRLEEEMAKNPNNLLEDTDEILLEKLKRKKLTGHSVTKQGIRALLENDGPDAGIMNSYVEAYGDNQDKIIGPFFKFMHDQLKEVGGNATRAQNRFLDGLEPLLKKAGVLYLTQVGEGQLGEYVGERVQVGKKQQVGKQLKKYKDSKPEISKVEEVINWEEWQFYSNYIGHDKVIKDLELEVSDANKKWNRVQTPANEKLYREAVAKKNQFYEDYMTQDKVQEFYKAEYLFKDEIGIKAKAKRDKFFEELNLLQEVEVASATDLESMDTMKKKWREYRYMYSLTDVYGNPKTDDELAIAERLNEYREQTKDFYRWDDIEDKFQNAYNAFIDSLEYDGLKSSDNEYQVKRDAWMEHNTVTEIIPKYFDIRTEALDERSELMKPLTDINAAIKDVGPLYKQIYALAGPSRDEQGHYDGNRLTAEVQSKIQELSQEIEDARYDLYTTLGLTRAQLDDYTNMLSYKVNFGQYETLEDEKKVERYERSMSEGLTGAPFNLSVEDAERIIELDIILSELTRNNFTRHYINTIEEMLDVEATEEKFEEFLDELGVDRNFGGVITEGTIEALLNPKYEDYLEEFLTNNEAFSKWFHNNHFRGERIVSNMKEDIDEEKSAQEIFIKTALWSYSAPKHTEFYKSFPLEDSAGNITGVLEYEGLPRVPNMEYRERVVKDEYITKEEKFDRIDEGTGQLILANKDAKTDRWLPRTMADGAKSTQFINDKYMDMFYNNRAKWDVVQYAKQTYLKYQDGMERGQRTGIAFPKMRKGELETYKRGYLYRAGEENVVKGIFRGRMFESMKRIFMRQEDDIEVGMSSRKKAGETANYESMTRPISGTYDLHENEVSTNIFGTMHDYLYSAEYFKSLSKINSFSQSLKDMVNYHAKDRNARKLANIAKGVLTLESNDKKSKRAWAINNMMEQYFEGVEIGGADFHGKKTMAQVMNHVSGANSKKWFSFNEQASATNALQGKTQMYQKTWDRRFPSLKNLAVGSVKSTPVMAQYMMSSYSKRVKPVQVQLLNVMNAIPDNVKKNVSETANRNIAQDVFKGQIGYISRTNMQNQVEVQGFYGMLDKIKYKFQINGKGPKVSIDDAVHLVNGNIETVPGVPEEFSISYDSNGNIVLGKKIKTIMSVHENYLHKTIGMAGKTSEGELLSRALVGKYMFSLFKWMPSMLMDRFAFRTGKGVEGLKDLAKGRIRQRVNWHTNSVEYGRVIGAFDAIRQFVNTGFKHVNYKEISDALQVATWYIMYRVLKYVIGAIRFNMGGTDQDPEDRTMEFSDFDPQAKGMFERLKNAINLPDLPWIVKSRRAVGIPYDEDGNRMRSVVDGKLLDAPAPFDYSDYFKEQALRLTIRVNRENNTFMPWNTDSGGGIIPILYNIGRFRSPMQEGVLEDYAKLGNLFRTETGRHPEKNEIGTATGPYIWQQEGKNKWIKWYMDYRGFTGSMVDPSRGIKGESMNL